VVARLIVFSVAVVWVFGWLMASLALIPVLFPVIWEGNIAWAHPMEVFMFVWFVATAVIVGVFAAVKGFRFVGKWERK